MSILAFKIIQSQALTILRYRVNFKKTKTLSSNDTSPVTAEYYRPRLCRCSVGPNMFFKTSAIVIFVFNPYFIDKTEKSELIIGVNLICLFRCVVHASG